MKSLELVVHVFAGKLPLYAQHLRFQISSLLRHPPQSEVVYTLFWAGEEFDKPTAGVVSQAIDNRMRAKEFTGWAFNPIVLPRELLFRRAIGRHQRSQETKCDAIWYCDADMYFGPGAIDAVCNQVQDDGKLYFPRRSLMSLDHATGQQTLEASKDEMWPQIDPAQFKPQRNHFAIGGIQILGRETAKRVGYLGFKEGEAGYNRRHTKWSLPVDPEKPFAEFRDDTAWRRAHFSMSDGVERQKKIDVPHLYRLRHEFSSLRPDGFAKAAEAG